MRKAHFAKEDSGAGGVFLAGQNGTDGTYVTCRTYEGMGAPTTRKCERERLLHVAQLDGVDDLLACQHVGDDHES